ncbi:MAG: DNA repair protein RecO [Desulfobacteraceae bacterium]
MPARKTPAIVIRSRDYGEADRIVTFLSPEVGRLTALAKGARKSKRRFLNSLESFSRVNLIYTERRNRDLGWVDSCELVNFYPELRQDLNRLGVAACLSELAGEIVGTQENVPEIFAALEFALNRLDQGLPPESLLCSFLIRLLALAGYGPHWQACLICQQTPQGPLWFDIDRGGIVCASCRAKAHGHLYPLQTGTWKLLRLAQSLPLAKVPRLRFPLLAQKQCLDLVQAFIRHHWGRELRSFKFLEKLRPPDP